MIYYKRANIWSKLAEQCGNIQSIDCKGFEIKVLYARKHEIEPIWKFVGNHLWSRPKMGAHLAGTVPLVTRVHGDRATRDKHAPVVVVFHQQRPAVDTIAHEAAHAAMIAVRMHNGKTWWGQYDVNGDHDEQIAYLTGHITQQVYDYTRGRSA